MSVSPTPHPFSLHTPTAPYSASRPRVVDALRQVRGRVDGLPAPRLRRLRHAPPEPHTRKPPAARRHRRLRHAPLYGRDRPCLAHDWAGHPLDDVSLLMTGPDPRARHAMRYTESCNVASCRVSGMPDVHANTHVKARTRARAHTHTHIHAVFANGSMYEGEYHTGSFHGVGKLVESNGQSDLSPSIYLSISISSLSPSFYVVPAGPPGRSCAPQCSPESRSLRRAESEPARLRGDRPRVLGHLFLSLSLLFLSSLSLSLSLLSFLSPSLLLQLYHTHTHNTHYTHTSRQNTHPQARAHRQTHTHTCCTPAGRHRPARYDAR